MAVRPGDIRRFRLRAAATYWLLIPAAVIGGGLGLDRLVDWPQWPHTRPVLLAAGLLLGGGCWLIRRATADFARYGQGTPAPQDPPRRLVTEGCYAWCRHPMWLGYDLAALGVVLLLRSWGTLLVAWPLLLALQIRFLKSREELLLQKRFGREYREYCRRVPLLLPGTRPAKERP